MSGKYHQEQQSTISLSRSAFAEAMALFTQDLRMRNMAYGTITSYTADVRQFLSFVEETTIMTDLSATISKREIAAYLVHLAERGLSAPRRARKFVAIKEFFAALVRQGQISTSPTAGMTLPKEDRRTRVNFYLDKYLQLLAAAGGNPRDYCILQLFLQTGIRVSELVDLVVDDVDLLGKVLQIRSSKGGKDREVVLSKKGLLALKSYLSYGPSYTADPHLFLNCQGSGVSNCGVEKLVEKYRQRVGSSKVVSYYSLNHTFATHYKAEKGVSPFQLRQWLGHESLTMTQLYVPMAKQQAQKVKGATSYMTGSTHLQSGAHVKAALSRDRNYLHIWLRSTHAARAKRSTYGTLCLLGALMRGPRHRHIHIAPKAIVAKGLLQHHSDSNDRRRQQLVSVGSERPDQTHYQNHLGRVLHLCMGEHLTE